MIFFALWCWLGVFRVLLDYSTSIDHGAGPERQKVDAAFLIAVLIAIAAGPIMLITAIVQRVRLRDRL